MPKITRPRSRKRTRVPAARAARRIPLVALALAVAATLFTGHMWAQPFDSVQGRQPVPANFDIRVDTDAAGYLARHAAPPSLAAAVTDASAAGRARLREEHRGIELTLSPGLGALEIVGAAVGGDFLTAPGDDRPGTLRAFLADHAAAYGLSSDAVQRLELVTDYLNPAGNMGWAELEQRINDLPVFQGMIRGGFTARGELARTTGSLAPGLDAATLGMSPGLTAAEAIARAAATVGWRVDADTLVERPSEGRGRVTFENASMAADAKAWLVYFPLSPGAARLAWAAEIWGDPDVFLVLLDAGDGTLLFRKNLTEYQTQSATYTIYDSDSPAPMSPSTATPNNHLQAPYIPRVTRTLIGNEPPNTFNDLGWMTDGTNGVHGETQGNNVIAGIDRDGTNGPDAPVAGTNRTFSFAYDPETDAPLTVPYQHGEVTTMFYWANRFHDSTYLLGFTEAARNFQTSNFGREGAGNDRVLAEGQDSSGLNNANFATPPDGTSGRMQMYIFPGSTPDRSSGLDQDVVLHELTHGLSNRLHGNAFGLNTTMARGLGEGWSDFYARALLSTPDEDANGIYTIGGWVTHQFGGFVDNYYYGIRRFPYAVRSNVGANGRPHNPLTLADIDQAQIDLSDGAFPRSPTFGGFSAFLVHNIGEVWCMALLEARARFITRLGFAAGNQRFLQYVTDGMKLDPLSPDMLQGRDAIIAAANAGGGADKDADIADIRIGFATRGMGASAVIHDANSGAVSEAYNLPGEPLPSFSIADVSVTEGDDGPSTATFTVTLANPSSLGNSRVRFATGDGTATSGTVTPDYGATSGELVFSPGGAVTQTISVTILGDTVEEPNETFFVNLWNPVNATIADARGVGTILNDDSPMPFIIAGLTAMPNNGGWMTVRRDLDNGLGLETWLRVPWPTYNAKGGGVHAAAGDVDGDGLDEIVVGFEAGGNGWIGVLDDGRHGYALLGWMQVPWTAYNTANGEVYPAVGDLDADGAAEIVAGLGPGGGGWFAIFQGADLARQSAEADQMFAFESWRRVNWEAYNTGGDGATHPAVADIDNDGLQEIVLGLGVGSNGWIEIKNSDGSSTRQWVQVSWPEYNAQNGTTYPAADSGLVAIGLGQGGQGRIEILSAGSARLEHSKWLQVSWPTYNNSVGETHPALGHLGGDMGPALVVGLAPMALSGGWFEVIDPIAGTSAGWTYIEWDAFNASGGGLWPAVGRIK